MGDILPFVAKVRASGDWTAAERARLEELADRFAGMADKVEVVFGTTDEGDPWCVVKDENEDILVHVARIDGRFVVHYALDDAVSEGSDLTAALGERLGWDDARADVIVPFSRQAQSFIALLIASAFVYESSQAATDAPQQSAHAIVHEDSPPAAPLDVAPVEAKRDVAAHATVLSGSADPAPAAAQTVALAPQAAPAAAAQAHAAAHEALPTFANAAPAATAPAAAAPMVMAASAPVPQPMKVTHGTDGDDHLQGGSGSDHLMGGAGDDTLAGGGARHGGYDLLDGGAGADRIELGARVFAIGGAGADSFVVEAPKHMGDAGQRLGVILDFNIQDGDRLVTATGQAVSIVSVTQMRVAVPFNATDPNPVQTMVMVDGHRVEVDLNGDHQADGYVVLTQPPAGHAAAEPDDGASSTPHDDQPPPAALTGHAFSHDLF